MKPNTNKEVKEAILKEVNKIAEDEFEKSRLGISTRANWIGGFISGYLFRVTELMKQQFTKTIEYPNKIYVCEYKGSNDFGGGSHFVILVAACDSMTAKSHVKEKIGIDSEPTWIMDAVYPTIWNNLLPLKIQVKILSNSNYHTYK